MAYIISSGESSSGIRLNNLEYDYMDVFDGGTANCTTVNAHCTLHVYSGGVANSTMVNSGGYFYVSSGGKLTGKMTFESGAIVSACEGASLDFDLTQTTVGADALVNDLSIIRGTPLYTLTVDGTQTSGDYMLADGAAGFNDTISVVNASGAQLGILSVGQKATINDVDYTLNLSGGSLSVTVANGVPKPEPVVPEPVIHGKIETFTGDFNGDGSDDIAWRQTSTGLTSYWQINDKELTGWQNIATIA